jgi:hypothetical protein
MNSVDLKKNGISLSCPEGLAGSNREPQNFEGWFRSRSVGACAACAPGVAQPFYKIDLLHSFDIRYPVFDIRCLLLWGFLFDQPGLKPET